MINDLVVRDREPQWEPFPQCVQKFPLGKLDQASEAPPPARTTLKDTEQELFDKLDCISGTAKITIHVQNGLPVSVQITRSPGYWQSVIRDN